MKGFPNQVASLSKLAVGMRDLVRLADEGENPRDDGILGEAFVRSGVAGRGHGRNQPSVEEYLQLQRRKSASNQSFRTTARGLRELFLLLGLIEDRNGRVTPTDVGRQAAAFAEQPIADDNVSFGGGLFQIRLTTEATGRLLIHIKCYFVLWGSDRE